jgi:hypothetical protein
MTKEDWACRYYHVTNTANSYWEKDTIMNDVIKKLHNYLGDMDSSNETSVLVKMRAVVIPKMQNHSCLILFLCNADKWTNVFRTKCR